METSIRTSLKSTVKNFKKAGPLYLITDTGIAGISHKAISRRALSCGIRIIQLREKNLSKKETYMAALHVRRLTARFGAIFIVNDYVDIAMAVDADGVHLGQDDLPLELARRIMGNKKLIGVSTHNTREATKAMKAGADYIGYGPLFHTDTKNTGRPRGIASLRMLRSKINIPIVAIGGISCDNISDVLNNGADAAAVISGILKGHIGINIRKYFSAIK